MDWTSWLQIVGAYLIVVWTHSNASRGRSIVPGAEALTGMAASLAGRISRNGQTRPKMPTVTA